MTELVGVVLGACILGAFSAGAVAVSKIFTQGNAPRHPFCTKLYHWNPECNECELERSQQMQHEELTRALAARVQAMPIACNVHGQYECQTCIGVERAAQADMQRRYTFASATGEQAFKFAQLRSMHRAEYMGLTEEAYRHNLRSRQLEPLQPQLPEELCQPQSDSGPRAYPWRPKP